MTFQELLADPLIDLPITQDKNKPFDLFIQGVLREFLNKVNQLDNDFLEFHDIGVDPTYIKVAQTTIVEGLLGVIREYYNGFPYNAYRKLDMTLRNEVKDLYAILKQKKYDVNENFYRIRIKEENFPLESKDLFHIPFENRGRVTTQRYSIPGFPSLYLGRTLYVCWEELNRPQINTFQAVRLRSVKPIQLLDLTPPMLDGNPRSREVYTYFMTWPLIACCCTRVKDYSDTFKPEYIIPQLLLQWIRENDQLDGIRYQSTHIKPELYKQPGELGNVVLPVKQNKSSGHCNKLSSIFEMTQVISWQLHEYALGGQLFLFTKVEHARIDAKLPLLELINGRKSPYSYSVLGKLEDYLDGMETKRIS